MARNKDLITVYPAHAGVILGLEKRLREKRRLSRTRGGDPVYRVLDHN